MVVSMLIAKNKLWHTQKWNIQLKKSACIDME